MGKRPTYKINDKVKFSFAGSIHSGQIYKIEVESLQTRYRIIDKQGYKYPIFESKVIGKV